MNNYKIKLNDEAESKEAQELFFELGYYWNSGFGVRHLDAKFLYAKNNQITMGYCSDNFSDSASCELTLPQLRDLVVLHRNDIHDANWVTEGDDQIYQDSNGKSFIFREQSWDELQRHEMRQAMWKKVKPKPQAVELEQGLISGADALRALADGKEVERKLGIGWCNDVKKLPAETILHGVSELRIKPRTITLNVEIPAPFKPKVGDYVYFLCSDEVKGYAETTLEDTPLNWGFVQFGAWRTEEEIKQVVAALRGGIKA